MRKAEALLAASILLLMLSIPAVADHHHHYHRAGPNNGCTWDGWNQHISSGNLMRASTRDVNNGCGTLQLKMARYISNSWYVDTYSSGTNQVGPKDLGWPDGGGHWSDHNAVNGIGQNLGFRLY